MKKTSIKGDYQYFNAIAAFIELCLQLPIPSEDVRLHLAVLADARRKLLLKLVDVVPAYKVKLTQAEALAVRLMYIKYERLFKDENFKIQLGLDVWRFANEYQLPELQENSRIS